MHSKKFFAIFVIVCMLSTDFMIPAVLAGGKSGGHHGIELLLAAGILAKLLRKKGHHHHHGRHSHGHSHHSHGPHGHGPHEAGTRTVEVVHVAPPMGGYSSRYPTTGPSSYGGAQAATTSFSSSIEYPFNPSASHAMPMQHMPMQNMPMEHMPYGAPSSAATFIGYEPQPVQVYPGMPLSMPESGSGIVSGSAHSMHA